MPEFPPDSYQPFNMPVSLEKWLQRIEDKQAMLDDNMREGMSQIRQQIETLEKSLPDRYLTRREWDVVLEAGRVHQQAQDALSKANNERHTAESLNIESRLRSIEDRGWWVAGAFGVALLSFASSIILHMMTMSGH